MSQNDPNNSGFGTGTTGNVGSGGTSTGAGYGSGGTGTGMGSGGGMTTGSGSGSTGGFGVSSGSDFGSTANTGGGLGSGTDTEASNCPHCGQAIGGGGLEQFLGRLGITDDMLGNLKNQFGNVDIDEYLNTARDYLKNSGGKATTYAKENPGKVAAGVAALALGAGLLYASVNRDKS
jgi:hypothetical protein